MRAHWVALLGELTAAYARAAKAGGSPARPVLPGVPAERIVPGLEGFARMSVAWGAWLGLASNPPVIDGQGDRVDVLRLVIAGLLDGTDTRGPFGWGPIQDRDQRIVEAAELATGLWLGRVRLSRALGPGGLVQVLSWLGGVHGKATYDDNWVLFPTIVATVQRAFGQPVPDRLIDAGLDTMLHRYRGDGWYADGPGHAFDDYTGWAIHWHLLLWAQIDGARRPRVRRLVEDRARTYLRAVVPTFASDGSRPLFGRSLGYRFAAAAPFALAALLGLHAVAPGLARRIASGVVRWHLDRGALDPTTGWLRRGVAGERPTVCERYVSAGAVAWAAHALVALGLPAEAPFWSAVEKPLPAELADGRLALRSPGFLLGWQRATGETWLLNAKSGHPTDIPGHDYTPYYGKFEYRSHFPFTVRTGAGRPGPDGAVLVVSGERATHRGTTKRGGVGPGWAWSVYEVDPALEPGEPVPGRGQSAHRLTTVVLPWRELMIRLTGIRPRGPVLLAEGPPALPAERHDVVERRLSPEHRWAEASTPRAAVAIRALAGYDAIVASDPTVRGPDINLVAEHAEQPVAMETAPRGQPRIVATATYATARPRGLVADLEAVTVRAVGRWTAEVRFGAEEVAVAVLADGAPMRALEVAGRTVEGRLRVVRARTDGSSYEGESIRSIGGVIRLDRPGAVSIRRDGELVATLGEGFALSMEWVPAQLRTARWLYLDGDGDWRPVGDLDRPNGVTTALIRRLQRRTGHRLVTLRLAP